MSRRSATTLSIQVRLRIPPGSNTAAVLEFVRRAIKAGKNAEPLVLQEEFPKETKPNPLHSLDTDSMIVKLEKKETVYL